MKLSLAMLIVVALATASGAQQSSTKPNQSSSHPAASDSAFAMKAAQANMAEVELGKLALQKAMSDDVKKFAQMMVDDHSKANGELTSLAGQKSVSLPTEPLPPAKAAKDHLSTLSGAAFDKAYMDHMVKDHEKAVALFSKEASGGKDPDTTSWAEKTLPTLQQHLAKAREVAGKVGTSSR